MKNSKFLSAIIGAVLIIAGFGFLFESLSIPPRFWILPVSGAALLFVGLKSKLYVVRDIGIASLVLGISTLLEFFLISPVYGRAVQYTAIAVFLAIIAFLHKNTWIGALSAISLLFAVFTILNKLNISSQLVMAYSLILIATAFVVLFIFKYEKWGFIPLFLGILLYLLSVPCFLLNAGFITEEISKIITASLLIITGVAVLIFNKKEN